MLCLERKGRQRGRHSCLPRRVLLEPHGDDSVDVGGRGLFPHVGKVLRVVASFTFVQIFIDAKVVCECLPKPGRIRTVSQILKKRRGTEGAVGNVKRVEVRKSEL